MGWTRTPAGPAPTPLASTEAMVAAWGLLGDPCALLPVAEQFGTWEQLAAQPQMARMAALGPAAGRVPLPATCPPLPPAPAGAGLEATPVSRYDNTYPRRLDPSRWPVLYQAGSLPECPTVAVVGPESPSSAGVEFTRTAALAASVLRYAVTTVLGPGVGRTAAQVAVDAGARVVVVVPAGLALFSPDVALLEAVVAGGGCVLSNVPPYARASLESKAAAERLTVDLVDAVVVCEVGLPYQPPASLLRLAVAAERPLVVRSPQLVREAQDPLVAVSGPLGGERGLPATALGLPALADPHRFTPDLYGTSAHIQARVQAGLPAADRVVARQEDMRVSLQELLAAR